MRALTIRGQEIPENLERNIFRNRRNVRQSTRLRFSASSGAVT
jgi:hypothetical protein